MALSLSMTRETGKRTTDMYLYEQAVLLSKSASEYALLRIALDGPCSNLGGINFRPDLNNNANYNDDIYDVNISLRYSYTNLCASNNFAQVTTAEQNGSVLMDITVSVNDTSVATEPIRYFRRTLQKL
jgi:hypothetical protein